MSQSVPPAPHVQSSVGDQAPSPLEGLLRRALANLAQGDLELLLAAVEGHKKTSELAQEFRLFEAEVLSSLCRSLQELRLSISEEVACGIADRLLRDRRGLAHVRQCVLEAAASASHLPEPTRAGGGETP